MKGTKILCWNVNGIRAAQRHGLIEWLNKESPDILCLQETKASPNQLAADLREPGSYQVYWNYSALSLMLQLRLFIFPDRCETLRQ